MSGLLGKAPERVVRFFGSGLRATFTGKESFRLETIALCILVLVMAAYDWPS